MLSIDFSSLSFFDGIVALVIIISAIMSTLRGLTREFLGLSGWFISIGFAQLTSAYCEAWLANYISVTEVASILGWVIPFTVSVVIWYIMASLISPGLTRAGLGGLDRWLGVLFGALRGFLIMCLLYGGIVGFTRSEHILPVWVTDSASAYAIRYTIGVFSPLLPHELKDSLSGLKLPEGSETLGEDLSEQTVPDAVNPLKLLDDEQ